jgi:hypothetical protein
MNIPVDLAHLVQTHLTLLGCHNTHPVWKKTKIKFNENLLVIMKNLGSTAALEDTDYKCINA